MDRNVKPGLVRPPDDFRKQLWIKTSFGQITAVGLFKTLRVIQKNFDKIRLTFEKPRPAIRNIFGVVYNHQGFSVKITLGPFPGQDSHFLKLPKSSQSSLIAPGKALQGGDKINACGVI